MESRGTAAETPAENRLTKHVTITAERNVLTVEGARPAKAEHEYLFQGIATRPFRRIFSLADHVPVKGAAFENGLR